MTGTSFEQESVIVTHLNRQPLASHYGSELEGKSKAFPFMHGKPPIGTCHKQHSNKNGGPIAGVAVYDD